MSRTQAPAKSASSASMNTPASKAKGSSAAMASPSTPSTPQTQQQLSSSSPVSTPQTPASARAATIERITTHMNADHADSLTRYLEYFGGVPSVAAHSPQMTSFSEESMTITSSFMPNPVSGLLAAASKALSSALPQEKGGVPAAAADAADPTTSAPAPRPTRTTTIPFSPPLKSISEARARLIEMDKKASKAGLLGRAPETVKRYVSPFSNPLNKAWVYFVSIAWLLFVRRATLAAGGILEQSLKIIPSFPAESFARLLWTTQPVVLGTMVVLHVAEAVWMAGTPHRHTVPVGSDIWLKWIGSTAFEGFPVWSRFAGVVQEEKVRRQLTMH